MEIENISASSDLTFSAKGSGELGRSRVLLRSMLGRFGDRFGDSSDMSKKSRDRLRDPAL